MKHYIDKDALVVEIEKRKNMFYDMSKGCENASSAKAGFYAQAQALEGILSFINTLEVKEVDLDVMQRMEECLYRQVGCTMYEGHILECKGACSWVIDYPRLKELKAQKGE